nr:gastrula zinc finger protein XlCGF57.1-like [Vanessa tameamea]
MAADKSLKSYENCCRTCLNEETTFDIFMETLNSTNLADILISCTRLNIQKEDCLPKKMCGCCYNCLMSFYHFREIAEKVDTKLRKNIPSNNNINCYDNVDVNKCKAVEIKGEHDLDVDYYMFEPKIEMNNEDNQILDENKNLDLHKDINASQNLTKFYEKVKKEKYKCANCNKTFRKLSRLQHHVKKHTVHDNYDCDGGINSKSHEDIETVRPLNDNSIANDNPHSDNGFPCRICPSKFKSTNSLSAHMRKHTEKGRVISCTECGKIFKKISHLKRHEVMHSRSNFHKCSLCPRSFHSEEILKGHMNKHNGIKPHNCPMCPKSFAHLSTLTSHIKVHKKDKFLCPTCGKEFDSSANLDQHVRRHLGLKQFECTLCPRKFVSKGELKSHTVTHTGERSYTCDQCGATFTKRSSLGKHKLRHLGIKPHQCETCSMKFSSKDHLKRHNRIHTGEKPYKCDMCERAFTQSNDLVKHRRAHLGEKIYKCTECSESFRLHIELRQHLSEHYISSQLQISNKQNLEKDGAAKVVSNPVTSDITDVLNDTSAQINNLIQMKK